MAVHRQPSQRDLDERVEVRRGDLRRDKSKPANCYCGVLDERLVEPLRAERQLARAREEGREGGRM